MGSSTIASTHMHRFPGTWRISISWCKTPYPSARTRRYGGPSACPVSHLLSGLQRLHWEHAAPTGNAEIKATKSDATSRAENDGSKIKATNRDELRRIATNRDGFPNSRIKIISTICDGSARRNMLRPRSPGPPVPWAETCPPLETSANYGGAAHH